MDDTIHVTSIERLRLSWAGWDWPFAMERKSAIDAHWGTVTAAMPFVFNGQVLLCRNARLDGGELSAEAFTTDFKSFLAWRNWGYPDAAVTHCFGSAAIISRESTLLYGQTSARTVNPGKIYPPGGMLDQSDLTGDRVDVQGSISRELREETGLEAADAEHLGFLAISHGRRMCVAQLLRFDLLVLEIVDAFAQHNAAEAQPELERLVPVTPELLVGGQVPPFATALAEAVAMRPLHRPKRAGI